jgi:hypothetical protein
MGYWQVTFVSRYKAHRLLKISVRKTVQGIANFVNPPQPKAAEPSGPSETDKQ